MRLVVIIPSAGRREMVALLVERLGRQQRLPDEVMITAPDEMHVPDLNGDYGFPVSIVLGKRGLPAQRNNALEHALGRFDLITFFDDDFIPADNYLRLICEAMSTHLDWAVLMGHVVRDGAHDAGLTWEDGVAIIEELQTLPGKAPRIRFHVGAYGCNMTIRTSLIGDLRFDERLVLYGWQEDIDFTSQLRSRGRVVGMSNILGVHLGHKSGRVSGECFGYSQVVNPIYLIRKGSVPASFALELMSRNIAANLIRFIRPEPHLDRRGRLRGNLLALAHVLQGRIEPEYILHM